MEVIKMEKTNADIALSKIRNIIKELSQTFLEREDVIIGLVLGLICDVNIALLGPPGTGKSKMVNDLCSRFGGKYMSFLLSKFTTPEELFGPPSIVGLEKGLFKRITTNKLPEADIVFLDEGFKSNAALLNSLLKVANERVYDNGEGDYKLPLKMLVIASNELPVQEENLEAFWDRFLLRYVVNYIREDGNFLRLLKGDINSKVTTISKQELEVLQSQVRLVEIPDVIFEKVISIHKQVNKVSVISDRRYKETLILLQGMALLDGRDQVNEDDLLILANCYWTEMEQIKEIRKILIRSVNPYGVLVVEEYDKAVEIYNNTVQQEPEKMDTEATISLMSKLGMEANSKLIAYRGRMEKLRDEAAEQGRDTSKIEGYIEKVSKMSRDIVNKYLLGRR